MMKIVDIASRPFHELVYRNVAPNRELVDIGLPFLRAEVDELQAGLEALLVTGDLQGREKETAEVSQARLLGLRVADELDRLVKLQWIPPLAVTGTILVGDLYARENLDGRGGSGDVRDVWKAFARRCRWVAGVAGNHDLFGKSPGAPDLNGFDGQTNAHFLDGDVIELDGLKLAGLSGVMGNPRKPFRRGDVDFLDAVSRLCNAGPDF